MMAKGNKRKSYVAYSMEQKLKCIKEIEAGKSITHLSKEQNIPKPTIETWLKQKETKSFALSSLGGAML